VKLRFIFNPISGRAGRNAKILPLIEEVIRRQHLDATLVRTEGPGHATDLAREAVEDGCARVVAVGGDGTMNEVAQALLHTSAALALVPCGSGNGLALHLGLPLDAAGAIKLALDPLAKVAAIDTGLVNGRPFFNAMGVGLDADVSSRFNLLKTRGLPAYAKTALAAFLSARTQVCLVSNGGSKEPIDALLIAVANSDQYGNKALIAPGARVDDGELDLVAVKGVGFFGAAVLGARLFMGSIDRSRSVRRMRGTRFTIERKAPGLVHTDGETHLSPARVDIQVIPRSLRIVIPANSRAVSPVHDRAPCGFSLQWL
jgi:YegS/Rv2252/BmrU family lipid kinase